IDHCSCSHCESVYSPAAYFVDLLQFLKRRPPTGTVPNNRTNARDVLLDRRPDLGKLLLTCENTETPLLHVDLVNEILEHAVSNAPWNPIQTIGDAASLQAEPPSVDAAAYAALKDAVHPFNLPFFLDREEARVYLGHLGTSRWELMEAFRPADGSGPSD